MSPLSARDSSLSGVDPPLIHSPLNETRLGGPKGDEAVGGRAWRLGTRPATGVPRGLLAPARILVVALLLAAAVGCDGASQSQDRTSAEQASEEEASEEESDSALAEIHTSAGVFSIEDVEITDRWPPDCGDLSPTCSAPEPGYKVLVVWLDPGSAEDVTGTLAGVYSSLYVVDSEGERTKGFAGGMVSERFLVAFTPPESSSGFTLHWPDNDPIELDI